ncbi:MAG: hypothetical protein BWY72_01935 [Bacteroidetes bacterium ADurb.Bin416]|nr:MAG: hypothetical protein BWY72_01935 [Bacteroidetes bacterium ADurb.Bin416]
MLARAEAVTIQTVIKIRTRRWVIILQVVIFFILMIQGFEYLQI